MEQSVCGLRSSDHVEGKVDFNVNDERRPTAWPLARGTWRF